MADLWLTGNGRPCPACGGDGEILGAGRSRRFCAACRGLGRVALPEAEIVGAHVEEARRLYWPAWPERWRP